MKFLHILFFAASLGASTSSAMPTTCIPTTCTTSTTASSQLAPPSAAPTETPLPASTTTAANPTTGLVHARQKSIPPYTAIVTAAPTQDAALASLGWYQTTYYECRTRDGKEHCGWHIPVQKLGSGVGGAVCVSRWHAVVALGFAFWMVM